MFFNFIAFYIILLGDIYHYLHYADALSKATYLHSVTVWILDLLVFLNVLKLKALNYQTAMSLCLRDSVLKE